MRDETVRPQDDLFAYVNGRWLAEHEIPADRASDGTFWMLRDRAEEEVRAIVEKAADAGCDQDDDARKVGDFYASFMDVAAIEAAGVAPIGDELAAVSAAADHAQLALVLARLQRVGVCGAFAVSVLTDAKNSQRNLMHLNQAGLGLPDESYYRDDKYAEIRTAYAAHIEAMFALVGVDYVAADVIGLETALAAAHWDVVKRRDNDLQYNLMTVDELVASAPGFTWVDWLWELASGVPTAAADGSTELVVGQPSFGESFAQAWAGTPLAVWQAWAAWRIISTRAPYLSSAVVAENFAFYGTTLTGAPQIRERWKRGVTFTTDMLGEAVGRLYVERNFPPEAKAGVLALVANLQKAYQRSITDLAWMGPVTRQEALVKLTKFTPKIELKHNAVFTLLAPIRPVCHGTTTSLLPRRSVRCQAVSISLSGTFTTSKVSSPDCAHVTIWPYTSCMVCGLSPLAAP
jgi:putative endopeptidase